MNDGRRIPVVGLSVRPLLAWGAVLTLAVLTLAAQARLVPVAPAQAQSNSTITLTTDFVSINEKDGGSRFLSGPYWFVYVTATLDGGARSTATTVSLSVSGTATRGTDYKASLQGSVTIAANESSAQAKLILEILNDTADEGDETIVIGGSADGFTVNPATITLVDDDYPSTSATLSVSPKRLLESAEATVVTVTAKLDNGARTAATPISLQLGGTATADDYTYTPVAPAIDIAEGSLSGTVKITITPVADGVDDNKESIVVSGSVASDSSFGVTGATIELLDFPPPAAVADLRASALSSSEIRLEWTRPSGPIDGYRLERHSGHNYNVGIWGTVSPAPGPTATSYTDGGLTSLRYRYRLFVINDSGESGQSNWAETEVLVEPQDDDHSDFGLEPQIASPTARINSTISYSTSDPDDTSTQEYGAPGCWGSYWDEDKGGWVCN